MKVFYWKHFFFLENLLETIFFLIWKKKMFQDTKDTFSETQHTLGIIIILEVTAKNDFFHSLSKVLWFNDENKGGQYLLSFTSQLKTISNCLEKKII